MGKRPFLPFEGTSAWRLATRMVHQAVWLRSRVGVATGGQEPGNQRAPPWRRQALSLLASWSFLVDAGGLLGELLKLLDALAGGARRRPFGACLLQAGPASPRASRRSMRLLVGLLGGMRPYLRCRRGELLVDELLSAWARRWVLGLGGGGTRGGRGAAGERRRSTAVCGCGGLLGCRPLRGLLLAPGGPSPAAQGRRT